MAGSIYRIDWTRVGSRVCHHFLIGVVEIAVVEPHYFELVERDLEQRLELDSLLYDFKRAFFHVPDLQVHNKVSLQK
jgi:hypothetical protein